MDNDTKIALDSVNKRIDRNEEDIKELRRTHEENIKELRSNDERNKELTTSLEKTVAVFAEKVDNYISSERKKSEKTDKLIEQYGERIKVLEETPLKNKVKFFTENIQNPIIKAIVGICISGLGIGLIYLLVQAISKYGF